MTKKLYKTCSEQKTAASLNYTGRFVAAVGQGVMFIGSIAEGR